MSVQVLLMILGLIIALLVVVILRLHKTIYRYRSFGVLYHLEALLGELTASAVVTDPSGRMVYVNASFIQKSGYTSDELLGEKISMLKANLTTDYVAGDLWQHLKTHQVWRGPFINQRKNGEIYTEEFTVFQLHDSLGDIYYCAIGYTIANRFLEEQAIQNVQRQSIRFKENFISNLSHEVRTPLNAMIGLSQLGQKGEHPERQLNYFSKINVAAKQLMQLMDDILDFSKIESGSFNLVKSRFNFMSLLTSLIGQYGPIAAEKRLEFLVIVDEFAPQYIFSDSYRLEQILSNLISNAIKFTEKGEIRLNIGLSPHETKGYILMIEVKDSGIGMTNDELNGLFNPFSHLVSDEQKRHTNSSGLGMAITKQIVDLMRGTIVINSTPLQGTTVTVHLPFEGNDLELPIRDAGSGIEHLQILLAEPPSSSRDNALDIIRGFQYEVTTVDQYEDVLTALSADRVYDLIILDWRIAQAEHYQLLHQIDALGLERTKRLLVTPYPPESLAENTRRLIHGYLPKPYTASMLFDELASLFIAQGFGDSHQSPYTMGSGGLLHNLAVLLVDDNPVNNLIAKNQFENEGAKAVTFLKASKALDYLRQHHFDFVVSDIDMPEMNGFEFLKALRSQGFEMPVAALTANTSDQYRQEIVNSGFDLYISKPLTQEKMMQLHEMLVQKQIVKKIESVQPAKPPTVAEATPPGPLVPQISSELLIQLREAAKLRKPKVCKELISEIQSQLDATSPMIPWLDIVQKDLQTYRFDAVIEAINAVLQKIGGATHDESRPS